MDNKMIFIIVLAIVLGMLVANMFKEVCGCKNLIEGQVIINSQGCIRVARTQPIGLVNEEFPECGAGSSDQAGWCKDAGARTVACTNSVGSPLSIPDDSSAENVVYEWCSDNCGAEVSTSNEHNCSMCCQTPEVESDIRH